jgi:hypothetical protein
VGQEPAVQFHPVCGSEPNILQIEPGVLHLPKAGGILARKENHLALKKTHQQNNENDNDDCNDHEAKHVCIPFNKPESDCVKSFT